MKANKMTSAEKIRNLQNVKRTGTLTPAEEGFAAAKRDNQAAAEMHDEENPDFLFSTTWTDLLVKIAKGTVDAQELAKKQLAARGLNNNGKWVGFDAAKENTNKHWDSNTNSWMYVPEM